MTTLHILNKSPSHPSPASQCKRFYSHNDSILLIEDAVYYTLTASYQDFIKSPEFNKHDSHPSIYALKEDIDARGIAATTHKAVKVVNYDGFVELTASHDKTSSWY